MKHLIFAAIALLLGCASASAQVPPYVYPVTVGTSPAQVLGINPARKRLIFINPNATALVAVCPPTSRASGGATITCAINGAGSITILPYGMVPIEGIFGAGGGATIPSLWNGVASAGSSALTIMEWE